MKTKLMTLLAVLLCWTAADAQTVFGTARPAEKKILVAYFSWGGNTQHLAEEIADMTGGTLFRIETVNPYPSDYNECTVVARNELDNGIRPELKGSVDNLDDYDVIFVGCPVWWHTAPMAIWSFLETSDYDFSDKIIIPFCTYASTYREETLVKIVELTPASLHLQGFGATGRNTNGVENWLRTINIIR
ncbi:flavodoxin [Odoribacter lunatus]|uniref:flavodoxin n=1 Tax=Odoribacter lunatus TaxID=2941335 RepID=UPI00203F196D|nr:flavodoxin [Odoribacter lunatus]